mgnify:CR=1 FL=1
MFTSPPFAASFASVNSADAAIESRVSFVSGETSALPWGLSIREGDEAKLPSRVAATCNPND